MKTILIRTLGGKEIGYGHFYRCLSLSKGIIWLNKNINIVFMINSELVELTKDNNLNFIESNDLNEDLNITKDMNIDLFIFDSYLGNNEYLNTIKNKTKLMLIDDNNDIYDSSIPNILYNGNIFASKLGYHRVKDQLQLLGTKYLIMKEEYWDNNKDEFICREGILVTTGGTDKYGVMIGIIEAIKDINTKIRVIIGPGYNEDYIKKIEGFKTKNLKLVYKPNGLKEHINTSKVVITAGGSTVYEVLSQKSIPILFSIADNQDLLCKTLNQCGISYIGKYPNINYGKLCSLLEQLSNEDINKENEINSLVTGNGAVYTAKSIIGMLDK